MLISNICEISFTPLHLMKEQVTDMSIVLQGMKAKMWLTHDTINEQYAEIARLNRNIECSNRQIHKKDKSIAKLTERLSKYEKQGKSPGSSTPSGKESMKDEIVRRTKTLRKLSGRKSGGQEGHNGHKLSCNSSPDEVVDNTPDHCTDYGELLADAERVLDYVTQAVSTPEQKVIIKEIHHYVIVLKNCDERRIRKLKIKQKNS